MPPFVLLLGWMLLFFPAAGGRYRFFIGVVADFI